MTCLIASPSQSCAGLIRGGAGASQSYDGSIRTCLSRVKRGELPTPLRRYCRQQMSHFDIFV